MVELAVSGAAGDVSLQLVDRAGGFDGADVSAASADEEILVSASDQEGEIGGALVET